jgi:tetratricopeptide (TPR) repeat protein
MARQNRLAFLVFFSLLAGGLPLTIGAQDGGRAAGGMCVANDVRQRVAECPAGGAPAARARGEGSVAPHLAVVARPEQEKKQGPRGPSIEIDRQDAAGRERTAARALELLQREIEIARRIADRARPEDPQGAEVLLRLAETQFELQSYWNTRLRSFDQPLYDAQQANNQSRVQQIQRDMREAQQQLSSAREAAITTYATLVQRYPNFARMDQVLFSLAFGLEEMHQFDRARQVYFRLIKGFPESRFIPYAYLSFAEYYFGEGEMDNARQFYTKVTEFPAERNPVFGYALYKQAWVLYNLEDFAGSLRQFARTIEFAQQNPQARDAANLARQSRRELVMPFARVGRPNQALELFRRYAENDDQALEMLEALGELYFDTGQWPDTIAVYHRLMAERANGDKFCYWQSRVTNAIISSRPRPEQVREIQRLVDVYNQYKTASHPAEPLNECKQATATTLIELATAWHREAVGTDSQPGTNDRSTMDHASALYDLIVNAFPDLDQLEFPQIGVTGRRPTRSPITAPSSCGSARTGASAVRPSIEWSS